ncbi:hypothetical protein E0H75_03910 [Kribbella capetownensis]|uniref:Uncharacterized protein n=1 Tax=Kribbella capetownensis TaxID=1572659 RepID=A0A4R0JZ74_9ACTN|nr:hypothetical protein [Kribbella capetownensis]TCC52901.1 hypothetical protein E0H75_03910 [Kribbella capetownensis]
MTEVERRHRRVQRVVAVTYLGIPLVLLGIVAWISTQGPAATWIGYVVPAGMLVFGWILWRRHRYVPRWWAGVGGLFGGIAGLFATLYPLMLGIWWPALLALPALIVGLVVGLALARAADRALLVPVVPELAETPYELVFRLRGMPLAAVLLGKDSVTIQGHPFPRSEEQSRSYPLAAITGTFEVSLSGAERLKFPIAIPHPPVASEGPAIILQASGDDWVLPSNQAPTLIELLDRRRSIA